VDGENQKKYQRTQGLVEQAELLLLDIIANLLQYGRDILVRHNTV